ncbi:MAG: molybdenum cofactor guanylyltransferase [Solirubrobacteraceae bacterium]|jgi:molybdopterin-guanine dinucleotide biosynthesis protein A|nr:molybdenum cofactor guanylyltransferase [Solirubrobacteraceae bacterium]
MTVGGIVLAGGRSTRMGTPKADLQWEGVSLVTHVAQTLTEILDGPVLVVGAPGQVLPAHLHVVHDPAEGQGPLRGLATGLAAIAADVAFVCATDQPFVAQAAAPLIAALGRHDAAAQALDQPLGAVYTTALATTAAERLAGGDRSLKGLLRAIDTVVVPGDIDLLRSLDTPEDYERARS